MSGALSSFNISRECPLPLWVLIDTCKADPEKYLSCAVVEVNHYKEQDQVGHEFVVIHVHDGTDLIYLRLERRPAARKPRHKKAVNLSGSPVIRVTDDSFTKLSANVDVARLHHITRVDCATESPIYLERVCAICDTIWQAAPNYELLRKQCYWFCFTFIAELLTWSGTVEQRMPGYARGGKFGRIPILSPMKHKAKAALQNLSVDSDRLTGTTEPQPWLHQLFSWLPSVVTSRRQNHVESPTSSAGEGRKKGFMQSPQVSNLPGRGYSPFPLPYGSGAPLSPAQQRARASSLFSDGSATLAELEPPKTMDAAVNAFEKIQDEKNPPYNRMGTLEWSPTITI